MHYQLTPSTRTAPRVVEIFDMRPFAEFLQDPQISLSDAVHYISPDGVTEDDTGYAVFLEEEDCLLVTLDDGERVVTSLRGLRAYVTMTGQTVPRELN